MGNRFLALIQTEIEIDTFQIRSDAFKHKFEAKEEVINEFLSIIE